MHTFSLLYYLSGPRKAAIKRDNGIAREGIKSRRDFQSEQANKHYTKLEGNRFEEVKVKEIERVTYEATRVFAYEMSLVVRS